MEFPISTSSCIYFQADSEKTSNIFPFVVTKLIHPDTRFQIIYLLHVSQINNSCQINPRKPPTGIRQSIKIISLIAQSVIITHCYLYRSHYIKFFLDSWLSIKRQNHFSIQESFYTNKICNKKDLCETQCRFMFIGAYYFLA